MTGPFKAVQITDDVYWVGAIDWAVRDFHGYLTGRGTTYNAYLIMAEKVTLMDTVKAPFKDELLSRIASVTDPANIDYIISNHSEMDHSGCLPAVIDAVNPEKVFASTVGAKTLKKHLNIEREITSVKDGETLSLGNRTLTFLETRMLHWPDSMVSYLGDEKLLFSQDGFGMHLATSERFADQIPDEIMEWEAAKYYANILLPFSPILQKLLKRVTDMGLQFDIIAPDHGPIWREDPGAIVTLYAGWAAQQPRNKAVVVYDTMWGSTGLMAAAVCDGLASGGTEVKVMKLRSAHRSDVATEVMDAGAILVGSPTMNNNLFPTIADVLTYLKGLKPKHKIGGAFGSFGWSGEAVKQVEAMLTDMKVELVGDGIRSSYVPGSDILDQCFELGKQVSERLAELDE